MFTPEVTTHDVSASRVLALIYMLADEIEARVTTADVFDDVQHAYMVGVEAGRMERVEVEAQQRAQEILAERAARSLGFARQVATERHGPEWAALVGGGQS